MAKSIFNNFLKGLTFSKQQENAMSSELKGVAHSVGEWNSGVETQIKSLKKIASAITDKDLSNKVKEIIKEADELKSIRKDLKKKGKSITKDDAQTLISFSDKLDETITKSSELQTLMNKPSKVSSLASSTRVNFTENVKQISESGVGGDAATLGLRAISPEVAAITEGLGINLTRSVSGFFGGDNDDTPEVQATNEVKKATENVKNASDDIRSAIENTSLDAKNSINDIKVASDDIRSAIENTSLDAKNSLNDIKVAIEETEEESRKKEKKVEAKKSEDTRTTNKKLFAQAEIHHSQHMSRWDTSLGVSSSTQQSIEDFTEAAFDNSKKVIDAQKDGTESLIISNKKNAEDIIQADNINSEVSLTVSKDQHSESLEKLDDIEDVSRKGPGFFGTFFGKNSFIGKLLGRTSNFLKNLAKPLTAIASFLAVKNPFSGKKPPTAVAAGKKPPIVAAGKNPSSFLGKTAKVGKGLASIGKGIGVGALLAIAGIGLKDVFEKESNQEALAGIAESIGIWGKSAFTSVSKWVGSGVDSGISFYKKNIEGMGETIEEGVKSGFDIARKLTTDAIDEGVNIFKLGSGEKVPKEKLGPIASFYQSVMNDTTDLIDSGVFLFSDPKKTLKDTFRPLTTFFSDLGKSISDFFAESVVNLETTIGDFLSSFALGEKFRQKIGFRTSDEVRAEKQKDKKLISQANGMNVSVQSLIKWKSGEMSLEEIQAEARNNAALQQVGTQAAIMPQQAELSPRTQDSAKQIQEEIAQASVAEAIVRSTEAQINNNKVQQKETIKIMKEQENKKKQEFGSLKGLSNLDNTPIATTDIGLLMAVGGGI